MDRKLTANVLPIGHLEIYSSDVVIKRVGRRGGGTRGKKMQITEFSDKSRKRLAFVAANTGVLFESMVTLTYPNEFPSDGAMVKRHLVSFLKKLSRRYDGCEYLWFMEFQARGAPHFHIMLAGIDNGLIDVGWCAAVWYLIVDSGDYKHLQAGTRWEKLRKPGGRYAVKYGSKMRQKNVPEAYRNCGRFFGYSVNVEPEPVAIVTDGDFDGLMGQDVNGQKCIENGWSVAFNSSEKILTILVKESQE